MSSESPAAVSRDILGLWSGQMSEAFELTSALLLGPGVRSALGANAAVGTDRGEPVLSVRTGRQRLQPNLSGLSSLDHRVLQYST